MPSRATVDVRSIRRRFADQYWNTRGAIGRAQGFLTSVSKGAMTEARNKYRSHPVTRELSGGASSNNISGTITYDRSNKDLDPNLFTFIGFPSGSDPLQLLDDLFNRPLTISHVKSASRNSLVHTFRVNAPTPDLIYKITPMPSWAGGKSWVKAIEDGTLLEDSVNYYLAVSSANSRSGGGIQVKVAFRQLAREFNRTPYITAILDDLVYRLQRKISTSTATL